MPNTISQDSGDDYLWTLPRPVTCAWLATGLGILGLLFIPLGTGAFSFVLFEYSGGITFLIWLICAFGCVLFLKRLEGERITPAVIGVMAFALSLTSIAVWKLGSLNLISNFLLVIFVTMSWFSIAQFATKRAERDRSWGESLLCGPAIALMAPLLLFAARPPTSENASIRDRLLARVPFTVVPFAVVAGPSLAVASTYVGQISPFRYLPSALVASVCLSFCLWTWFGCALLLVLTRGPHYPRIPDTTHLSIMQKTWHTGLSALGATVLVLPVFYDVQWFIMAWIGCALLIPLICLPVFPPLPRLPELPAHRKIQPLGTLVMLTMPLLALGTFATGLFLHVVVRQLLTSSVNFNAPQSSAVDAAGITKYAFAFTVFSTLMLPYVAAFRLLSNRTSRFGYWAFVLPTLGMAISLITLLTIPFACLLQYVCDMGVTTKRLLGLAYSAGGYVMLIAFFGWAAWFPKQPQAAQ